MIEGRNGNPDLKDHCADWDTHNGSVSKSVHHRSLFDRPFFFYLSHRNLRHISRGEQTNDRSVIHTAEYIVKGDPTICHRAVRASGCGTALKVTIRANANSNSNVKMQILI